VREEAFLSIYYALIGHLRRKYRRTMSGKEIMLSFVASQAIALSQIKRRPGEPAEALHSHRRKSWFATVFDALFESRMLKAELEIEAYNRMYPNAFSEITEKGSPPPVPRPKTKDPADTPPGGPCRLG
jgi:hypothetical protein